MSVDPQDDTESGLRTAQVSQTIKFASRRYKTLPGSYFKEKIVLCNDVKRKTDCPQAAIVYH